MKEDLKFQERSCRWKRPRGTCWIRARSWLLADPQPADAVDLLAPGWRRIGRATAKVHVSTCWNLRLHELWGNPPYPPKEFLGG
jgi:hypothetical protein